MVVKIVSFFFCVCVCVCVCSSRSKIECIGN